MARCNVEAGADGVVLESAIGCYVAFALGVDAGDCSVGLREHDLSDQARALSPRDIR
jgi:hypothetical protein